MEKKDLKKSWVAPELIVLVRSKPEEAVLVNCKNATVNSLPNARAFFCEDTVCDSDCNAYADS
jgi:hypothetical protein